MYWCSKNTHAVHQVYPKPCFSKKKNSIATVLKINGQTQQFYRKMISVYINLLYVSVIMTVIQCCKQNIMEGHIINKTVLFLTKYCHTETSVVDNFIFLYTMLQRLYLRTLIMTDTFGRTV